MLVNYFSIFQTTIKELEKQPIKYIIRCGNGGVKMRIDGTSNSMPNMTLQTAEGQAPRPVQKDVITQQQNQPTADDQATKEKLGQAIDSLNEFFTINNSELKFVFHEGLDTYYAQLVNSETDEIIREIPSKKVLDVFYEMQKLVGMIVDKKI